MLCWIWLPLQQPGTSGKRREGEFSCIRVFHTDNLRIILSRKTTILKDKIYPIFYSRPSTSQKALFNKQDILCRLSPQIQLFLARKSGSRSLIQSPLKLTYLTLTSVCFESGPTNLSILAVSGISFT